MSKMRLRAAISCFITLTILSVCATAFSDSDSDKKNKKANKKSQNGPAVSEPSASVSPEPAGFLNGTGQLSVNGNVVRTGATILNGSTIASGPDGDASIDLGQLGRIQLRPNTTIKLALEPNSCRVIMERCGSFTQVVPPGVNALVKMTKSELTEVAVTHSEVKLKTGDGKDGLMLKTDENTVLHDLEEVSANGEATFTVNCCGGCAPAAGGYMVAPLYGLFALLGAGVAVTVGVVVGRPNDRPKISPVI